MSNVTAPQLHHLALTVSDVDASVRWYEDVFGIRFRMDVPHPGGVGKLLADDSRELMIVLHPMTPTPARCSVRLLPALTMLASWFAVAAIWRPGRLTWRPTALSAPTSPTSP